MTLSRVHTSAKASDVTKLLLLNKNILPGGISFGPNGEHSKHVVS